MYCSRHDENAPGDAGETPAEGGLDDAEQL